MSTLLVPWLAFPAVLAALSVGCGLLLERVSGLRLPGVLVLPCGFAVLSLVAQLATMSATTARLAVPAVLAAAVAGFGLSLQRRRGRRRRRLDAWAVAAALLALAAYAAPIVLSGRATFAGYIKLDDDSSLLAITDRAMEHGRSLAGVAPSTYFRTLDILLAHGYPLATFMPLGVGRALVGDDALWLYQPCMAFMAAMLALSLYELGARVIGPRWLRALAAFIAAQSALLYGYALWGGIKEVGTAWALPLLAAVVPSAVRGRRLRHMIPLATVTALLFGVLNLGALVWTAPALAFALVAIVRDRGLRDALRSAAAFAVSLIVLALPTIVSAPDFISSNIVSFDPLANLIKPLSPIQVAGIWPVGDFRVDPSRIAGTDVLIAVALVAAAAGLVWALVRRTWELPLYVVGALASSFVLYGASSPWIAGKAFATASPAVPLAALAACALLLRSGRPVEGAVLAAVVAGGVLWSNALQYHDAYLAPRSQLAELEPIGNRFAGDGPALMTEYQPYGVRHFLRKLDPEGASELRVRPVPLRNGQLLSKGYSANLDDFQLDAILVYRTLVLRRSPVESRPPSVYRLAWSRHWYEVWLRPQRYRRIIEHLSLGNDSQPAAVPSCADVFRLAREAGSGGLLAAVRRPPVVTLDLAQASHPAEWSAGRGALVPTGAGTIEASVEVPKGGRYGVWLEGSFRDRLEASMDGRRIFAGRNQLDHFGQYTLLSEVELARGAHRIALRYSGPDLHPGSGGPQFQMGPIVLSTTTADLPVMYVRPVDARTLCGKSLDWVEALGS
jgi:hypothetical protein